MSANGKNWSPGPAAEQAVGVPSRTNAAGKALWRTEPFIVWPRYARILSICTALSLLWFLVEIIWPLGPLPRLTKVQIIGEGGAVTSPETGATVDPSSFEQSFGARKLFVPEVPVESHELSRQAVNEQISRMKLTAIINQGGELVAWIEVKGLQKSDSTGRSSSTAGGSSERHCVRKGDSIGDFKVVSITSSRVDLKLATFDASLSY